MADIKIELINHAVDQIGDMVLYMNSAIDSLNGLNTPGAVYVKRQLERMYAATAYMQPLLGQDRKEIEDASSR